MAGALILARLFTPEIPSARSWALGLALSGWFLLTAFNLWIGVSRAGYSVREELPVFLLLFLVPGVLAWIARRWIA